MKKLIYLFSILFTVTLLSTSCEKENDVVTPESTGITSDQLLGTWDFVSLEVNGETYTGCSDELTNLYGYWGSLNICFSYEYGDNNEKYARYGINSLCTENFDDTYSQEPYELSDNVFYGDENNLVLSLELVDNSTLKVKYIKCYNNASLIGATLTLQKR